MIRNSSSGSTDSEPVAATHATTGGKGPAAPAGDGPLGVRDIRESMSLSYHMLSAPEAPAPTAMQRIEVKASTGWTWPGAITRPTKAVNTTSDITRGFSSAM